MTVHSYSYKAVRHALEAGVRSIEHGQMIEEGTAKLIKEKDAWVCMQPFLDDEDAIPMEVGSFPWQKYQLLLNGTDNAYKLAVKYKLE